MMELVLSLVDLAMEEETSGVDAGLVSPVITDSSQSVNCGSGQSIGC